MKLRPAPLALLVLCLAAPRLVRADDMPPPAPPPSAPAPTPGMAPAAGGEKKTEIDKRMDKVGKAFRQLRKQVADPAQNPSSIDLVGRMIAALKDAEGFTPDKASDLPADQRPKFVADYVAGLKNMEASLQKLSDTLTAGDNAAAAAMVKDIFALEKKDHQQFRRPEN